MFQSAVDCDHAGTRRYRAETLAAHAPAVAHVIGAMRAHVAEALSLEEMAEVACLSPFHFNRVFRAMTGTPPGEFLAVLRLDAAKRLLLTTTASVTDVCFDLGYASLGTFTSRFKLLIGLSPLQLRQLASDVAQAPLHSLLDAHSAARRLAVVSGRGVSGTVTTPVTFTGLIFLGLFPKPIPQGRPIACTTLTARGHFQLAPVPDGTYYLLGAAQPHAHDTLAYLLPGAETLVSVAEQPVLVRGGRASAPVELALRPLGVADPPILGVFPPLLEAPAAARAGTAY